MSLILSIFSFVISCVVSLKFYVGVALGAVIGASTLKLYLKKAEKFVSSKV